METSDPRDPEVDDGQALALEELRRWCERGEAPGGWKLGLTSGRSRDAFGAGIRPFGYILKSRILASGAELACFAGAGVENELCWVLAEPLSGAAVGAEDARRAVAGVAPAFELNENRLPGDAGPGARVADNLSQWGIVVGRVVDGPADLDALTVRLRRDGELVEEVAARGHIDDHYGSVARLARELSRYELGLEPGDHVITGAYTRHRVEGPGRWQGDFGPEVGSVDVRFV